MNRTADGISSAVNPVLDTGDPGRNWNRDPRFRDLGGRFTAQQTVERKMCPGRYRSLEAPGWMVWA